MALTQELAFRSSYILFVRGLLTIKVVTRSRETCMMINLPFVGLGACSGDRSWLQETVQVMGKCS